MPFIQSIKQCRLPGSCHDNGETIPAHSLLSRLRYLGNSYTNPGKHPEQARLDFFLIVQTWNNYRTCSLIRIPGRYICKKTKQNKNKRNTMTTSLLPVIDSSDPRLKLTVQNRMRNIFVTQSEDTR